MRLSKKKSILKSFLLCCFFVALPVGSFAGNIDKKEFYLSAAVDFPDDAIQAHYTPELVEKMMQKLKEMGVKRVYWMHYGDESYEMLWKDCGFGGADNAVKSIRSIGQPIAVAVKAAKKVGLEIYGYIKPYETGLSYCFPEGSPEAAKYGGPPRIGGPTPCMTKFTREHPCMRIKRKMTDVPANIDSIPICRIRLAKKDDSYTHIKKENIEIWTSPDNYKYTKKDVDFVFLDVVERIDHDVVDWYGKLMTPKNAFVRVLYIDNLNLTDKYIIITTNLRDGRVDFGNSGIDMIKAYGPGNKELPIVINSWDAWFEKRHFINSGLNFDTGAGRMTIYLDLENDKGIPGWIGFARGRNEYLPGALCEAYPEVRKFWLGMVKECIDAGVDGIDFRIAPHSTHTDDPFSYGFNEPIVEEYARRYSVNILKDDYNPKLLSDLRGEYYTDFLRSASKMIRAAGKKVQLHLEVDRLRGDTPPSRYMSYPWNITFDWQGWLNENLADEITLNSFAQSAYIYPDNLLDDRFAQELIEACYARALPIHYNRYIRMVPAPDKIKEEIQKVHRDGRIRSFILYEVAEMMSPDEKGNMVLHYGTIEQWKQILKSLED